MSLCSRRDAMSVNSIMEESVKGIVGGHGGVRKGMMLVLRFA